jgi:hypothetical protein
MTGMEWAVCEDSRLMFDALRRRVVSDRKWRLFVAAFGRQHADRLAESRAELIDLSAAMEYWADTGRLPKGHRPSHDDEIIFFTPDAAEAARRTIEASFRWGDAQAVRRQQADLLRELLGSPFRLAEFDMRWRTSDVLGLARAIDEDRAFERMPILADALMDAGCEQDAIIGHCRGDNRHVRGCWVLDLVLE